MALIDSFTPAVSGLKSQQRKIEVVGDNIANVDTTSFKSSRAEFSTIFSQVLSFGSQPEGTFGGTNPRQVGKGVTVATISKDFTQGSLNNTGVASDLAIEGEGFFVVRTGSGETQYTRDGSFSLNASNLLIDPATGAVVQGWLADADFDISVGGPLEDMEIPVGSLSIARATSEVTMQGILDAGGDVAGAGSWLLSATLYDAGSTNQDLISAENPLGLNRATASTPLRDLVVSLGDYVTYTSTAPGTAGTSAPLFPSLQTDPTGLEIGFEFSKGDRRIDTTSFVVGGPPPTGGLTLGELTTFLQDTFGVTSGDVDGVETIQNTYSHQRLSPVDDSPVAGTLLAADSASLTALTIAGGDFRGARVGDFLRYTSGRAGGQVAEIVGLRDTDGDNLIDTLDLRADGFNSLSVIPETGDTYVVQAPAGIRLAVDENVASLRQTTDVIAGAVTNNGGVNSLTLSAAAGFLGAGETFANAHGVRGNQVVEWQSGGATVQGWITSFTDTSVTVSWDSALGAQTPDAASSFTILERPPGSIEIEGNAGVANAIADIEVTADGDLVSLFTAPPRAEATGEGVNTTFTVFDSLGAPHEIEVTFVYEAESANGPNVVRYFAEASDDADLDRVIGGGEIIFNSEGQFVGTSSPLETLSLDLQPTAPGSGGVTTPLSFEVDFSRLSLLAASNSAVQMADQDGFRAGTLREFGVGDDGVIRGVFDNGQTRNLGQIALARFANSNGLIVEGSNYYSESANSGTALVGEPGTLGRGRIRGGALEESNVDLAEQFTELITGQRAFQANARTFSASDQLLQELVNLI